MSEANKNMSFGEALRALKHSRRVCRVGWNGKGMWLMLVASEQYAVQTMDADMVPDVAHLGQARPYHLADWIGMKTADNKFVPWLASQTDVLAEDWEVAAEAVAGPPDGPSIPPQPFG